MKDKKGFTLVELLAVIVILAIILVIAVPQIIKTIDESRNGALISSAKLIAASAEREYLVRQTLGDTTFVGLESIPCEDVVETSNDYSSCSIKFVDSKALVTLIGAKKFAGKYVCNGTRTNATVTEGDGSECGVLWVNLEIELYDGTTSQKFKEKYESGTQIVLEEPTKENYIFKGWEVVKGDSKIEENILTIGTTETIARVLWARNSKLTVTLNGGKTSQKFEEKYESGTQIVLEEPIKENYTFIGWELLTKEESGILSGNNFTMGNIDAEIEAKWQINEYGLTVKLNGGDGNQKFEEKYESGTQIVLEEPTKEGYTFDGWEITFGIAEINNNVFIMGYNDVVLEAKWKANKYEITFNANGGSIEKNTSEVIYDERYGELPTPTRDGYTFSGWYWGEEKIIDDTEVLLTQDTTFTAKWINNTYYVKYNSNGGSGSMSNSSHTYGISSTLLENSFTREGYTFKGWATSFDGSVVYSDKASVSNLTTTNGGTYELYAVWQANIYTIVYNGNGAEGSTMSSTHSYGTATNLTANGFYKEGWYFLGWSTTAKNLASGSVAETYVQYVDKASVSNLTTTNGATINLYAVWTTNSVSLENNNSGYGHINTSDYLWQVHPCAPGSSGYTFELGYNNVYGYAYDQTFDISSMNYFRFDIKILADGSTGINGSNFNSLIKLGGQIEFNSSGKLDDANEMAATWHQIWSTSYYMDNSDGWIVIYIPLSSFSLVGNVNKAALNYSRVYWYSASSTESYVGQMASPSFVATLPSEATRVPY